VIYGYIITLSAFKGKCLGDRFCDYSFVYRRKSPLELFMDGGIELQDSGTFQPIIFFMAGRRYN
jgi:hypothetical protein